jgi:hypothetical protein
VHIVIYSTLAREAEIAQVALGFKLFFFCGGHCPRFTLKEFYAAGGASGVPATAVQRITTIIF